MPEAKPIMIFHCRRHLYFPLPLCNLQNLRLPFIDVSYKFIPNFHYVDSGRKTTSLVILPKEIKSLGISTLPESISTIYTSCKSADKIIVLYKPIQFINSPSLYPILWDIILNKVENRTLQTKPL
jgi:hypothetical protein